MEFFSGMFPDDRRAPRRRGRKSETSLAFRGEEGDPRRRRRRFCQDLAVSAAAAAVAFLARAPVCS